MDDFTKLAARLGVVTLIVILLAMVTGCDEVKKLDSIATTRPALVVDIETPEQVVADKRRAIEATLAAYVVERENQTRDYIAWFYTCLDGDALIHYVARAGGTEQDIREWNDYRKKLELRGAELDAKDFELRAELDRLRMMMFIFEQEVPGGWLMGRGESK